MNTIIRHIVFSILLPSVLLIAACGHDNSPSPLKFKAYGYNPILNPGEPGTWDELMLLGPQVYWHDSLYYLFYTASNINGKAAVGLATSKDGFHFEKYAGNPILSPDGNGFDAYLVANAILLQHDTGWVMYFGAGELARYGPGQSIGRATATSIIGPWIKDEKPLLMTGSMGEWDAGFVFPGSIVELDDGSYRMYYTGGGDFQGEVITHTGLATSGDGINWKKYNDPTTGQHPFLESDPVLPAGNKKEWDSHMTWMAFVYNTPEGFNMYYTGTTYIKGLDKSSIGFASSRDGIHWTKHPDNPIYRVEDDSFLANIHKDAIIEGPWLVFHDTVCYMYYDYGVIVGKIGMATAVVK
ncbi:MAG: hypothetical protein H8E34_04080 [Bacteroidetes bacterium]|nr:hypothetical protein [Bacteroidota bacterium]MBL6943213.1 hypothetical protein [Bacteroidales bacterium]